MKESNENKSEDYELVENRSMLPYGDSTLSPPFSSTEGEVSEWKDNKNRSSDNYFRNKCAELLKEYEDLKENYDINEMISGSELQFKPVVGVPYYLYVRTYGTRFVSLVSPDEFGTKRMSDLGYLGSFKVDSNDVWREVIETQQENRKK